MGHYPLLINPNNPYVLFTLLNSLSLQFEANDDQKKYKVTGRYVIGGAQSRRDLFSNSNDFPELIQELEEVNKELSDAKKANQAREKTETKWIMTSEGCSATCGEGKVTLHFMSSKTSKTFKKRPFNDGIATERMKIFSSSVIRHNVFVFTLQRTTRKKAFTPDGLQQVVETRKPFG